MMECHLFKKRSKEIVLKDALAEGTQRSAMSLCGCLSFSVGPASWDGLRVQGWIRQRRSFTCKQPEIRYLRSTVGTVCSFSKWRLYRFYKVDQIRFNVRMQCFFCNRYAFHFHCIQTTLQIAGLISKLIYKSKASRETSLGVGGWIHPAANSVPLTGYKISGLRTGDSLLPIKVLTPNLRRRISIELHLWWTCVKWPPRLDHPFCHTAHRRCCERTCV